MKKLSLLFVAVISIVFTVSCVSKEVPVTETYYETAYRTETYTTTEDVPINSDEGTTNLSPKKQWYGEWFLKDCTITPRHGWGDLHLTKYYGYDISADQHSKSQIKIDYRSTGFATVNLQVFDLSKVGQISQPNSYHIGTLGQWEEGTYIPAPQEEEWLKRWCNPENILAICDPKKTTYILDSGNISQFAIVSSKFAPMTIVGGMDIQSIQLVWSDQTVEKQIVIKEKQVPYQVEKQRTVMQTKKVPFWEAIFH
jgi:hypothetical protein